MTGPAELHAALMTATGGQPPHRIPVDSPSAAPIVSAMVSELLDLLDVIEDSDGRAIWLTAEEVELDQWLGRLVASRDALRGRVAPRIE